MFPMLGLPVSDVIKEQSSKNLHLCLKDLAAVLESALWRQAPLTFLLFLTRGHFSQAAAENSCAARRQASPTSAPAKNCCRRVVAPRTSIASHASLACSNTPFQLTVIQKDFSKYPRVAAWLSHMQALPEYEAAHNILQVRFRAPPFERAASGAFARVVRMHCHVAVLPTCSAQRVAKKAAASAASKL